jgi:hypothetical protein
MQIVQSIWSFLAHNGQSITAVIQIITLIILFYGLMKEPREKRQEFNRECFFELLPRVGEVISDKSLAPFKEHMTEERLLRIQTNLSDKTERFTDFPDKNEEFLKLVSDLLGHSFPQSDRFRRRSLFLALDNLRSAADRDHRPLLTYALRAQIHDEAARFLILQAVKEWDEEMLTIFARLGVPFETLNSLPELRDVLTERFPPSLDCKR